MQADRERRGAPRPLRVRRARRLLAVAGLAAGGWLLGAATAHADDTALSLDPVAGQVEEVVTGDARTADHAAGAGAEAADTAEQKAEQTADAAERTAEHDPEAVGTRGHADRTAPTDHTDEVDQADEADEADEAAVPEARADTARGDETTEQTSDAEAVPAEASTEASTEDAAPRSSAGRTIETLADTADTTLRTVSETTETTLDTVGGLARTGADAADTVTSSVDEVGGTVSDLEADTTGTVHEVVARPFDSVEGLTSAGVPESPLDTSSAQAGGSYEETETGDGEETRRGVDDGEDEVGPSGSDTEHRATAPAFVAGGHVAEPHGLTADQADSAPADSEPDTDRGSGSAVGSSSAPMPTAAAGLLITRADLARLDSRRIASYVGAPAELPGATDDPSFSPD